MNENEYSEIDTVLDDGLDCEWVESIIAKVIIKESDEYHLNVLFASTEKAKYIKLFSTIVLNPKHKSPSALATSSDIESFFKSLKHYILQKKMRRPDVFISTYNDFANAEIKLCSVSTSPILDESPKLNRTLNRSKSLEELNSSCTNSYYSYSVFKDKMG